MSRRADRGGAAKPKIVRLDRCANFHPRCLRLIPAWRGLCWKHECEQWEGWPEV